MRSDEPASAFPFAANSFTATSFTATSFTANSPRFSMTSALTAANSTDSVLLRIASGDKHAVSVCFARYAGLVASLVRSMCPSGDHDDATQEVFLELWRHAARFDPSRSSESAFVAMVARRRLIDRLRVSRRHHENQPYESHATTLASHDHDRADACVEAMLAARVFEKLPEEKQTVLRLSLCEGFTHEQISSKTGLPVGTIKSHIRRGLTMVREALTTRREPGEEVSQ